MSKPAYPMSYRQLRDKLLEMNDKELDNSITVYDSELDEYFPIYSVVHCNNDVVEDGHVLMVDHRS